MNEIKLIVDSSSNLNSDLSSNLDVVPLVINLGNESYIDDDQLDYKHFLESIYANNEKSGTACPNLQAWLDALTGSKKAIILTVTSGLSGTYSSACQAAKIYEEENPGSEVLVIDSKSAGPELKLLIDKLLELVQHENLSLVREDIKAYQEKTHLLFSLESLHNLAVNGRINSAVAKIAGMLHIRMIGEASQEGTLEPLDKARGSKKTIVSLFNNMKKQNYAGGKVYIDHVANLKDAKNLKEVILAEFPTAIVEIGICHGLCSFYAEKGGLMVGFEG
ncbi:DegV family protein [Lactobacillus psittaci]|uniref:DegV family protein n=1 Tax=Lactobacillus psittaci DSM 15354 TaxID=1122152 RepID=A0A0R1SG60_9LACO|nr:DegV family protein [Lactobacillus psittaci]KRL64043.1 hypothetical protein FC23_GL000291 [Lactobacillus psittaci DSM 15354]